MQQPLNYCYTTLLATDDYLQGVFALHYSLSYVKSLYPLEVFVTDNVSDDTIQALSNNNIHFTLVKDLSYFANEEERQQNRYATTVNKIYILTLTNYSKALFLDADSVITNNIDYIFNESMPRANKAGLVGEQNIGIAGGYLLFEPNINYFNELLKQLPSPTVANDTQLLDQYYKDSKWIYVERKHLYHNDPAQKFWVKNNLITYQDVIAYIEPFIKAIQLSGQYELTEQYYYNTPDLSY